MRKIAILSQLLLGVVFGAQAQKKLSTDANAKYESEINSMITYLEETMNFLGDSTTYGIGYY